MSKQISLPEGPYLSNPAGENRDADTGGQGGMSRRRFLKSGTTGLIAGAVPTGTALPGKLPGQNDAVPAGTTSLWAKSFPWSAVPVAIAPATRPAVLDLRKRRRDISP